jgi:uncharacterized protein YbaP (TraB family)
MYDAWFDQEADALYVAAAAGPLLRDPELWTCAFGRRKEIWVDTIVQRIAGSTSNVLLIVRALHLVGDGNLLEAQGRRGREVEQAQ